jgi:hypothetical protein
MPKTIFGEEPRPPKLLPASTDLAAHKEEPREKFPLAQTKPQPPSNQKNKAPECPRKTTRNWNDSDRPPTRTQTKPIPATSINISPTLNGETPTAYDMDKATVKAVTTTDEDVDVDGIKSSFRP